MLEIDVRKEEPLILAHLAPSLPGKPDPKTLRRWILEGRMRHHDHQRIKMAKIYLPAGLGSSKEAYYRFLEALNS